MEFRNHLLSAIAKSDMHGLLPALSERAVERGAVLFEPGEVADRVFFPSNAIISVVTVMKNGQAVESSTLGYETALPLLSVLSQRPVTARMFAQVGGAGISAPASVLRDCAAASPELMTLLLRHADAANYQAERGVACNVLHDAAARLSRWLLMTQDRIGSRVLPLTQDYMAIMTGVQRTTISAVANQLKSEKLIRYSRGAVEVLNREGLEARSCECYAAIRDKFNALPGAADERRIA